MEALDKADALLRARTIGKMLVTAGSDEPPEAVERILFDVAAQTPKEMLDAYRRKRDSFDSLPVDPCGNQVRVYPGEWSILSGFPGTGKTTFIRQTVCHCLATGAGVFVATLEADPADFIVECAGTASGQEVPTEEQLTAFLEKYGDKLKVWGVVGLADHKKILSTINKLAKEEGVKFAFIDSLMALDIASDDYELQRKFANLLSAITRVRQIHIFLVAHPKKPISADQDPNIWDVAGSSDLGRVAFNVFFIRRGPAQPGHDDVTPVVLYALKQRTYGRIGELTAWFYREQRQFHVDAYAQEPTRYLPAHVYPPSGMTESIPESIIARASYVDRDEDLPPWEM